jgi:AcrR family transcriptional regulator
MKPDASKTARRSYGPVDDRLLGTAGRCFIEDGFGFGIDDILAQSGVAKMSLYAKFGSKYGLIERLLELAKAEWLTEMERVSTDTSLHGIEKVIRFVKVICTTSRDPERRTGLLGQALLEFPRTGKEGETHKKKDLVHDKARALQGELLTALEGLCASTDVANPKLAAQKLLLLINGYLVTAPLLGKNVALKITLSAADKLMETTALPRTGARKSLEPVGGQKEIPDTEDDLDAESRIAVKARVRRTQKK